MKAVRIAAENQRSSRRPRARAKTSDRRRGISGVKLLVVVDATDASRRALRCVGRILANRVGIECHLACIAARLQAELLESGGSELPEREEQIEADLRLEQHRWTAATDKTAERVLRAAR